ncbi:Tas retrotransposon peptidase A16 [Ostertagia ostertagi]
MGQCPKCNEDHHSSLCTASESRRVSTNSIARRQNASPTSTQHVISTVSFSKQASRSRPEGPRISQEGTNQAWKANKSQTKCAALPKNTVSDSEQVTTDQCVLQVASVLIFSEAEMDYEPINILLDSGAQRSFIRTEAKSHLQLPTLCSTKLTTIGMGELRETFNTEEVRITLKGLHSSKKLMRQSVHTKQKLTTTTRTAELSYADKRFISECNISIAQQTLKSSEVTPAIIIGQDLLNQVVRYDIPVKILPSGLILTPTIFGYTISGTSKISSTKAKDSFICTSQFNVVPSSNVTEKLKRNATDSCKIKTLSHTIPGCSETALHRERLKCRPSRSKRRKEAIEVKDIWKRRDLLDNSFNFVVRGPFSLQHLYQK